MSRRDDPVPLRPLFSWAQHEAELKNLEKARSHLATINHQLRLATRGKSLLRKKKRDAVHRVLKLEMNISRMENQNAKTHER